MVKNLVGKMPVRHRMPYDEEVGGDDVFLLNRTASGLFTLKPNITTKPCLFEGISSFQPVLQPAWNKLERKDYIVENVLREEFELTMESHPLYQLFLQGIPTRRQLVRIVNPYGIAMAYGFPSPMLPLSSSLDIATFFATHKQDPTTGLWSAVPEHDEQGRINVGVLYVLALAMPFPMMLGLSCIGMQAFKRPGNQKLFAINLGKGENFNDHRLVVGFQFRQNPEEVQQLAASFNQGNMLTPDELIAKKAKDILSTRCVSEKAFRRNCKNNPHEDPNLNRKRLIDAGVQIVREDLHLFTIQELNESYYATAEAEWDEMFSHVIAVHPGFANLLDDLQNFPNTEKGRKFFRK